jgi:pimeloyl-ACP methyl ester carboxylesterase
METPDMFGRLLAFLLISFAAAPAAAQSFTSDRISVEVRGTGPDVVLIPGLSSSPRVWESTIAALPGYRYHLVHVAGFAGKAPGANASGPVVPAVAEEIARYIAEAGLDRPALVGHSMGGTWAMIVAAVHPDQVSRLMVVDMLPFMGAMFGGPTATPESLRPIAEQMRNGIATATGDARRRTLERTIAGMVRTEALRPAAVEDSLTSDPAVSGQAMADLIVMDLRPALGRIRAPMTVLWVNPAGSPFTVDQMSGFYRMSYANAPQAVLKNIPDSYHFIMWDAPAAFQAELRTFLTAS